MITPFQLRINHGRFNSSTAVHGDKLSVQWALSGEGEQREFRVLLRRNNQSLFDSGFVKSSRQSYRFSPQALRSGFEYELCLMLKDENGRESSSEGNFFRVALQEQWPSPWIAPIRDLGHGVIAFERRFAIEKKPVDNAVLFLCGIGYHAATLNGSPLSHHRLAPTLSDYSKRCYYEILDLSSFLQEGENRLEVLVAQGWRRNEGRYQKYIKETDLPFFGIPQLTALLCIHYADGTESLLSTDEHWICRETNTVFSHLFDGETYDASRRSFAALGCRIVSAPSPQTLMCPDLMEPVRIKKIWDPISIHQTKDGYVFDLGQNIAGVCQIQIPHDLPEGSAIVLTHAELLDPTGDLYTAPLRGAKATDTFIIGKDNPPTWSPFFTYHGFRYVKVQGLSGRPTRDFLQGLQFYTDIDTGSSFRCGDPTANQLYQMILMTERDNVHGIATDCPQRDERMGWMNDATVRFEGMPYHFDMGRFFSKINADIRDTQTEDGAIACTAPFLIGHRPADPVSTSFLITAQMSYLHYGNTDLIREAYPAMCAWNDYLERASEDGIVPFSHYGDWASPDDCCADKVKSALTPGEFMSTGYHFYNAKLLADFAEILNRSEEAQKHRARAETVRQAIAQRWIGEDGTVCTGSQACQALALRLGILSGDMAKKAAHRLNEAVKQAGMRLTTGNLCTLYVMEMLSEYGYADTAWELITRHDYPSWGFMMRNGATTVWERFELKKDPGMNSHCHPMYGAVGKWFYSHLVGVSPLSAAYERILIRPCIPEKLLYAQANLLTCKGDLSVRWEKNYGSTRLLIDLPLGTEAKVIFGGKEYTAAPGTHLYTLEDQV